MRVLDEEGVFELFAGSKNKRKLMKTINLIRSFGTQDRPQLNRKQLIILLLLLAAGFALIAINSYWSHQLNTPLLVFLSF